MRHAPAGLLGEALDAHTRRWAQAINDAGRAYVTAARYDDRWLVRVSIGAAATERRHVEELWQIMQDAAHAAAAA